MRASTIRNDDARPTPDDVHAAAFEAAATSLMLLGLDGRVRGANASARRHAGGTPVGTLAWETGLVAGSRASAHALRDAVVAALAGAEPAAVDVERHTASGAVHTSAVTVTALGGARALLLEARDVTAERAAARLQRDLLGAASHELRTPLVGVRGALAMLEARQAEHGDARGRGLVRLARANADRLMRCVTDLLDLEHIRGGAVAVTLRPTSPGDVAHAAVEAVTPLAAERRVRVTVRETPCGAALADHHQAAQALITLVSNCVYAAHPDATLRVATTRVAGARVRIAVEDAGGAIPPERRAALVRRIDRVADAPAVAPPPLTLADALLATGAGGTEAGLGLAIARALVERQGGTLGASSDADRAAVCWVEFPAAEEVFAALALLE